jgi:hypothetical protein
VRRVVDRKTGVLVEKYSKKTKAMARREQGQTCVIFLLTLKSWREWRVFGSGAGVQLWVKRKEEKRVERELSHATPI